jgi:hypothetical protein
VMTPVSFVPTMIAIMASMVPIAYLDAIRADLNRCCRGCSNRARRERSADSEHKCDNERFHTFS